MAHVLCVRLVVEKMAIRQLRKMPAKTAQAIMGDMQAIAADPFGAHSQAKPLEGTKSGFRLRHGNWRVIYRIDREAQTVSIEAVKPRQDAYR